MNENIVVIPQEKYEELLKNNTRLKIIFDIVARANTEYGYDKKTSEVIDAILGIKR